jgi:hypothetical protein
MAMKMMINEGTRGGPWGVAMSRKQGGTRGGEVRVWGCMSRNQGGDENKSQSRRGLGQGRSVRSVWEGRTGNSVQ